MDNMWYLSTCSTCKRIIADLGLADSLPLQDIKTEPISPEQLDGLARLAGSYEALFSRRSRKFRDLVPEGKALTEKEIRDLILREYTFLKRPVIRLGDRVFAGSSPQNLQALKAALTK